MFNFIFAGQPVRAVEDAILSLSAPTRVNRSDELTIEVRARLSEAVDEGYITLSYDSETFEFADMTCERYDGTSITGELSEHGRFEFRVHNNLPAGVNEIGTLTLRARGAPGGRVEVQAAAFQVDGSEVVTNYASAYRFIEIQGEGELLPTTAIPTVTTVPPTTTLEEIAPLVPARERTQVTTTEPSTQTVEPGVEDAAPDNRKTILISLILLLIVIIVILLLLVSKPRTKRRRR